MVGREARGNRVRWKGVCTWYFQCGFCWLPSVCVLEVLDKKNSVLRKVGLSSVFWQLIYVV